MSGPSWSVSRHISMQGGASIGIWHRKKGTMHKRTPYTSVETTLSTAWARAFLTLLTCPRRELAPFMVSITAPAGAQVLQEDDLRRALDACLEDAGHQPVEKVAKSIFPQALWSRANGDRHKLYNDYLTYLPDYIAMEPTKNCYGLYFARLIAFGMNPKTGSMERHIPTEFLNRGG